jgi:hypothetical protein
MLAIEFLILVLAAGQILEIWRHGEILREWRAWMEIAPLGEFVKTLTLCTFCFSVWIGWVTTFAYQPGVEGGIFLALIRFLFVGLAVARASNLLNDLTHSFCRTPK